MEGYCFPKKVYQGDEGVWGAQLGFFAIYFGRPSRVVAYRVCGVITVNGGCLIFYRDGQFAVCVLVGLLCLPSI